MAAFHHLTEEVDWLWAAAIPASSTHQTIQSLPRPRSPSGRRLAVSARLSCIQRNAAHPCVLTVIPKQNAAINQIKAEAMNTSLIATKIRGRF